MNKKEIKNILNDATIHQYFSAKELFQLSKQLPSQKKTRHLPPMGADAVLSMRRGRTFTDKKKQANKWACRKSKGV